LVTDFGLARIEQDVGMTMTGDLLGTLRYMSPEQALAKRVVVDHRSDIYSLGVTLYELLTLQPVFTGDDRQELLRSFDQLRRDIYSQGTLDGMDTFTAHGVDQPTTVDMTVKPAKNGWEIDGSFKFNSTNHGIAIPNYLGVTVYPDMVGHAKFTLVDV
jgi:serine/threonine protein kinase